MNKNVIKFIAIALAIFIPATTFALPAPSSTGDSAPSTGGSTATAGDSAPSTGGSSSTSGSTPSTGDSGSTATPSTGDSGSTATPSTGDSGSTATPPTGDSTSTAGSGSGQNGGTPSSSSSNYSSSGSYVGFGHIQGCPLITSYMKFGANNDATQVAKLQNFLKYVEKLEVDVNGIFDKKTENAVIAFQNKYADVILNPWGGSRQGTGFVYITTLKKINQIACYQPLTLDPSELATIMAYKNRGSLVVTATPSVPSQESVIEIDTTGTSSNEAVFVLDSNENNTAAVAKASILSRFWNFLVYLFK